MGYMADYGENKILVLIVNDTSGVKSYHVIIYTSTACCLRLLSRFRKCDLTSKYTITGGHSK